MCWFFRTHSNCDFLSPLGNTLKESIKVHINNWQSLVSVERFPKILIRSFPTYAESVGNGKACYRQEIISWWGLSLSFLRNTLIIKYNILETGHENYQQPIFANHVKLLDCCRIQIDKWVYWSHWMNGFTLTMLSQFESFATQLRVFWTRK